MQLNIYVVLHLPHVNFP